MPQTQYPHGSSQATVRGDIACRRCRYLLRGLSVDGRCPECGLEVWETVLDLIDPAASHLPRLRNPVGVGNALLWLMSCTMAAMVLLIAQPVAAQLDRFDPAQLDRFSALTPAWLPALAGAIILAGLWSAWRLMPARNGDAPRNGNGRRSVRTDVRNLAGGLVVFGSMLIVVGTRAPWDEPSAVSLTVHLAAIAGACLALYGMRGIMETIGKRSREYRTSRGGRQRSTEMTFATLAVGVGLVLQHFGYPYRESIPIHALGLAIAWISMLMLCIGLLYMLVNVWWIRRALRRPPPKLAEIVEGGEQPGT